jgi:ribonuclease-3
MILGFKPGKLNIYKQALRHDSAAHHSGKSTLRNNNERLEFLGDAILSAVIAEMVFINYPSRHEGFLTQMRSKLVSRDMLNQLARKTGVHELLVYDKRTFNHPNGLEIAYGNAMEALLGAIFLDKGFKATKNYIIVQLINNHIDIEKLQESEDNYKSRIYEWAQGLGKKITFEEGEAVSNGRFKLRKVIVLVDGEPLAEAKDHVKKKAEQEASRLACEKLGIIKTA